MKNLLIIYNVAFLLIGNVLFSSIHYLHHHHHGTEIHEEHKCNECVIIKNTNNYVSDFQEVNFSNNTIDIFIYEYCCNPYSNIKQIYSSRSPPIS